MFVEISMLKRIVEENRGGKRGSLIDSICIVRCPFCSWGKSGRVMGRVTGSRSCLFISRLFSVLEISWISRARFNSAASSVSQFNLHFSLRNTPHQ